MPARADHDRPTAMDVFLKVPLTTRPDLLLLALGPKLASPLVGRLVALSDLLANFVERRRCCRPSGAWFLNLLRHSTALLVAPLGRLATGRMRERGTQAVELLLTLYSAARGSIRGRRWHRPVRPDYRLSGSARPLGAADSVQVSIAVGGGSTAVSRRIRRSRNAVSTVMSGSMCDWESSARTLRPVALLITCL